MSLMFCRGCTARFAVGLLRCPQCQEVSELFAAPAHVVEAEREAGVPKISVGGGPSNAGLESSVESSVEDERPAGEAPAAAAATERGSAPAAESDPVPDGPREPAEEEPAAAVTAPPVAPKAAAKKTAAKAVAPKAK